MNKNKNIRLFGKALSSMTMMVLFLISADCMANQSVKTVEQLVLCKNKNTVRTLRANFDNPGKCIAIYNKNGQDQVIGSGMNPDSCVQFVTNVRTNLEGANWNCRDIKESRTSMIKSDGLE